MTSPNIHELLIRPIICIGLTQGENATIIPLMCVDFFTHSQRSRRIFINWSYGCLIDKDTHDKLDDIKFDSELGEIKLLQLQKLKMGGDVQLRLMLTSERGRTFSDRIKEIIDHAEDGSRILFVIPKEVKDSEFYSALSISINPSGEVSMDEKIMGDPIFSLKELGVSITEPFTEIDPRGLS